MLVIISGPVIGYFQISRGPTGILIGTGVAVGVILVEIIIENVALDTMVSAGIGFVLGLIAANVVIFSFGLMDNRRIDDFFDTYSLIIKIVFCYIGVVLAIRKKDELDLLDKNIFLPSSKIKVMSMKILDTSAIIDGRILDICQTRFLEGIFVIPQFVLRELQAVADSSDTEKRTRGRRGLDIVKKLQEIKNITIKIFDKDYPKLSDVDAKIVHMADEMNAKIITADFNLNKIASVQGVDVLNVNELANAVKPPVLPGEAMQVFILKEGKEQKQGVAYLDDGTMVVVEDGRRHIGKRVEIVVSSILQTPVGRMIFARLA